MPHITTTCPHCGEVDLPLADVVLRVCEDDASGSCVVRCPICGSRFAKEASEAMMILMVTFGVSVAMWSEPAEVAERPRLPPMSPAEVAELSRALGSGELMEWVGPDAK